LAGAHVLENLSELLLTHHVAGRWRAPLSQRVRDVRGADGALLSRMVEAGPRDLARALAAAEAAAPVLAALPAAARDALALRFAEELAARAEVLAWARRLEGGGADGLGRQVDLAGMPPGPLAVLGTVAGGPAPLAGVLAAALRAGRPAIVKPAPRAALSPLVLIEALVAAGVPPGAVGLVQGGGAATGAGLLALPGLGGAVLAGKPAPRPGMAPPGRLLALG
jgi:acyl-CoA reductase-like NAD-dependent aldehyde dehydrogenase